MPRNGAGVASIPNSFTPTTTISSSAVNANFSDLADMLTNSIAADGQTVITAALKGANGSAATPSYGFNADTDTGMYRKGVDQLGFATNGTERVYINSAGKLFALGAVDIAGALNLQGALTGLSDTLSIAGVSANAAGIALAEDTDNGVHAITLRAAAAMAASFSLTLPDADGSAGQVIETDGSGVLSFANRSAPTGGIIAWPTGTAPTGWLECDGSAVSRTTFAALFAVIAETYGNGDGSTTFNLPDLRGEFIRGFDNGAGNDPNAAARTDRGDGTTGDNVGTKQSDEFELHGHPFRTGRVPAGNGNTDNSGGLALEASNQEDNPAFTGTLSGTVGEQIGGSGGDETRPRNVAMMWIIRT